MNVIEIDTSKGDDVFVEKRQRENNQLREIVEKCTDNQPKKVTVGEEINKAKLAFSEASELITNIMSSVKMGQHIELEQVNPVINKLS